MLPKYSVKNIRNILTPEAIIHLIFYEWCENISVIFALNLKFSHVEQPILVINLTKIYQFYTEIGLNTPIHAAIHTFIPDVKLTAIFTKICIDNASQPKLVAFSPKSVSVYLYLFSAWLGKKKVFGNSLNYTKLCVSRLYQLPRYAAFRLGFSSK